MNRVEKLIFKFECYLLFPAILRFMRNFHVAIKKKTTRMFDWKIFWCHELRSEKVIFCYSDKLLAIQMLFIISSYFLRFIRNFRVVIKTKSDMNIGLTNYLMSWIAKWEIDFPAILTITRSQVLLNIFRHFGIHMLAGCILLRKIPVFSLVSINTIVHL